MQGAQTLTPNLHPRHIIQADRPLCFPGDVTGTRLEPTERVPPHVDVERREPLADLEPMTATALVPLPALEPMVVTWAWPAELA